MELQTVVKTLERVPPAYLDEVQDFLEFIIEKKTSLQRKIVPEWKAGALKGTFIMSDDFDEPMEEFKDYM